MCHIIVINLSHCTMASQVCVIYSCPFFVSHLVPTVIDQWQLYVSFQSNVMMGVLYHVLWDALFNIGTFFKLRSLTMSGEGSSPMLGPKIYRHLSTPTTNTHHHQVLSTLPNFFFNFFFHQQYSKALYHLLVIAHTENLYLRTNISTVNIKIK